MALVQVIDGDGNFCKDLSSEIDKWGILNLGKDYKTVCVLGCQSSGKSTLLNLLFGTSFQMMDAEAGRTQTTLGIWMGKSSSANTLVFDVEGTDGRERGEEQSAFERKTSLFSLAMAEILLVNLWATDVGRYNAANYSLLRTVFELNLQLFGDATRSKTMLLFVIRDHDNATPLQRLQDVLNTDMQKIWDEIIKPDNFKKSHITDFFDMRFTSLPHKRYAADAFAEGVQDLKRRFEDPTHEKYYWAGSYKTDIPLDGLHLFASNIWDVIKENRDLDLPTQREVLAICRCDEIAAQVLEYFAVKKKPIERTLVVDEKTIEDFGPTTKAILDECIEKYDEPSKRYVKNIAEQKGNELKEKILKELENLFLLQLTQLGVDLVSQFKATMRKELPEDKCSDNFAAIVHEHSSKATHKFEQEAMSACIHPKWSYENKFAEIGKLLKQTVQGLRAHQFELLSEEMNDSVRMFMFKPMTPIFDDSEANMWEQIRAIYAEKKTALMEKFMSRLKGFECSDEEAVEQEKAMNKQIYEQLFNKMKELSSTNNLLTRMESKFQSKFTLDANGVPVKWEMGMDVDSKYTKARDDTLRVIDLFSVMRMDEKLDEATYKDSFASAPKNVILIQYDDCKHIESRFGRECIASYQRAKDEQEGVVGWKSGNIILAAVMVFLGWDELWWFLSYMTNPFFFMLVVILGGAGFGAYKLNLHAVVVPIVQSTVMPMVQQQFDQLMNSRKEPKAKAD